MTKKYAFLFVLLIILKTSTAQSLHKITVNGLYCCNLHTALQDISKKYDLKFNYNPEAFKQIEYSSYTINKPLDIVLDQLCFANKLKYFIEADSTINIVDKWYDASQETLNATLKYNGIPERFGFDLTGKIIDKESRESLPYVTIMVKGTNNGTLSNVDGYFSLL